MSAFETYAKEAAQLEGEIARNGIILGVDWKNDVQVRTVAKRALTAHVDTLELDYPAASPKGMATLELVGLSQLMLRVMKESADEAVINLGGEIWKALGRALWDEARMGKANK